MPVSLVPLSFIQICATEKESWLRCHFSRVNILECEVIIWLGRWNERNYKKLKHIHYQFSIIAIFFTQVRNAASLTSNTFLNENCTTGTGNPIPENAFVCYGLLFYLPSIRGIEPEGCVCMCISVCMCVHIFWKESNNFRHRKCFPAWYVIESSSRNACK